MAECVGCGHCCLTGICVVGFMVMKAKGPVNRCKFLLWSDKDKRYWCKLVLSKESYKEYLHIGAGCCQTLNSWRKDVQFRG